MAKNKLLSYKPEPYTALNATGFTYVLQIERTSWWGLSKRIIEHRMEISFRSNSASYFEIWDDLIKTGRDFS